MCVCYIIPRNSLCMLTCPSGNLSTTNSVPLCNKRKRGNQAFLCSDDRRVQAIHKSSFGPHRSTYFIRRLTMTCFHIGIHHWREIVSLSCLSFPRYFVFQRVWLMLAASLSIRNSPRCPLLYKPYSSISAACARVSLMSPSMHTLYWIGHPLRQRLYRNVAATRTGKTGWLGCLTRLVFGLLAEGWLEGL